MHPCDRVCSALLIVLSNCIWWTEADAGQSRERHGGAGEGIHQEAAVVAREDEPAAAGGLVASEAEAGEAEGLVVGGCRRCRPGARAAAAAAAGRAAAARWRATAGTLRRSARGRRARGGGGAPGRRCPPVCPTTTSASVASGRPPSTTLQRNTRKRKHDNVASADAAEEGKHAKKTETRHTHAGRGKTSNSLRARPPIGGG